MLKSTQRIKPFKLLPNSQYILPFCFLFLTGFTAINLLLLFFLSFRLNHLAQRKNTFVQLVNGQAIVASEQEYLYRHPEVIKNVVRQWTNLTFNWDGIIPGTQKPDRGYELGKGKKVTTNAYFASFLLQSGARGFRQQGLEVIAEITPHQVFSGQARSKIIISYISPPRQIKTGSWEIDLISTRLLIYANGEEEEIEFNKTFTLRAVDIPESPLADASAFEHRVYVIRQAGLEITKIVDYQK